MNSFLDSLLNWLGQLAAISEKAKTFWKKIKGITFHHNFGVKYYIYTNCNTVRFTNGISRDIADVLADQTMA